MALQVPLELGKVVDWKEPHVSDVHKLGISAKNFENLCMAFQESILTKRVGNDNAVADIVLK